MPITQYLHHQRFSPAAIRLRAMTNETETLTSGIDPASFSSVIKPTNDLFRYVNGPWIDTYRLPDDRSRYGSFDKLAEDAENQVRDILAADDCPAVKSEALYRSFGKAARTLPAGWRVLVLSSHTEFERAFGRSAEKKRKLYNGMLKCDAFFYHGGAKTEPDKG